MPEFREPQTTPMTLGEIKTSLAGAWGAVAPPDASLNLLTAHVAIETGDGTRIKNYNLGNARPRSSEDWTSFRTHEVIGGQSVVVDGSKFAAYASPHHGAVAYLDLLRSRFSAAYSAAEAGDPELFALRLSQARYYTADPVKYAAALKSALARVQRVSVEPEWTGGWFESVRRGLRRMFAPRPPCGCRAAVREVFADAVANGTWRPIESGYVPKRGDLVLSARGNGDPTKGGEGHLECVESSVPGGWMAWGGNENDVIVYGLLPMTDKRIRGFVVVPARIAAVLPDMYEREHNAGVREVPGPGAHPRIQEFHARTRRGGSSVAGMPGYESDGAPTLGPKASDENAWCASCGTSLIYEAIRGML